MHRGLRMESSDLFTHARGLLKDAPPALDYQCTELVEVGSAPMIHSELMHSNLVLFHPDDYGKLRQAAASAWRWMQDDAVPSIAANSDVGRIDRAFRRYLEAKKVRQDANGVEDVKYGEQEAQSE